MLINTLALVSWKRLLMRRDQANMTASRPTTPKRGGTWTRVAIFITSYILLLGSLIEWVLIIYLYGNKRVDSKMSPSLALALTAVCNFTSKFPVHLCWSFSSHSLRCRYYPSIACLLGNTIRLLGIGFRQACYILPVHTPSARIYLFGWQLVWQAWWLFLNKHLVFKMTRMAATGKLVSAVHSIGQWL